MMIDAPGDKSHRKAAKKFSAAWQRYLRQTNNAPPSPLRSAFAVEHPRWFIVLNGSPLDGMSPYDLRLWLLSAVQQPAGSAITVHFSEGNLAAVVSCEERAHADIVAALGSAVWFRCSPDSDAVSVLDHRPNFGTSWPEQGIGCAVTPPEGCTLFFSEGSVGDGERRTVYFYFPPSESPLFTSKAISNASRATHVFGFDQRGDEEGGATSQISSSTTSSEAKRLLAVCSVPHVPGLFTVPEFLTHEEHDAIISQLGAPPGTKLSESDATTPASPCPAESSTRQQVEWEALSNRKVAHFNRRFYYKGSLVGKEGEDLANRELPPFYAMVRDRLAMIDSSVALRGDSLPWPVQSDYVCDQLTVNFYEYQGAQGERCVSGIARHVDTHSSFGDAIFSISLGSHTIMNFQRWDATAPAVGIYLPPRSLLIMSGEARYSWTHCISPTRVDVVSDMVPPLVRGNRWSLTWRKGRDDEHRKDGCICPALCDGVE